MLIFYRDAQKVSGGRRVTVTGDGDPKSQEIPDPEI
jgi:hypothetical protein